MDFKGDEKRQYLRLDASYVLSYQLQEESSGFDVSQTKNISQGGVVFNTNEKCLPKTVIKLVLRLPFSPNKVEVTAEVIDSEPLTGKGPTCSTRIKFLDLPEEYYHLLGEYIKSKTAKE